MKTVHLIFPHQLFRKSPLFETKATFFLIEEHLFFKQYPFHKQKIAFHRAAMKAYEAYLKSLTYEVIYIEATESYSDIRNFIPYLKKQGVQHLNYIDPTDDWLQRRLKDTCAENNISTTAFESPMFINSKEELATFFKKDKKKFHQTTFYTKERKRLNILLDKTGLPEGGKWTFDKENRKKYPAKKTPPFIQFPDSDIYYEEAKDYVNKHFSDNIGLLSDQPLYPANFGATSAWLEQFLENRFLEFGTYEDAIVAENSILNHSVLTPMLNIGLITPHEIVDRTLEFANKNNIPINSTEGFIRQIIGWREFMRGMYELKGHTERSKNYWGFTKPIPKSFYNGTTGILPIDITIKKILKTGYCHHIERLMVLGNFMLLCEFDPDAVYQWFMEFFIDAYDWVMVPNVYGMSQFADGGLFATKPYISGSNYLMKMSDYKKGDWQATWDGLFWRFMDVHRDFFEQNPRLGMLVGMLDKMPEAKRAAHFKQAHDFLETLE